MNIVRKAIGFLATGAVLFAGAGSALAGNFAQIPAFAADPGATSVASSSAGALPATSTLPPQLTPIPATVTVPALPPAQMTPVPASGTAPAAPVLPPSGVAPLPTIPGAPNTGAGGEEDANLAIILTSSLIAIGAAAYLSRKLAK